MEKNSLYKGSGKQFYGVFTVLSILTLLFTVITLWPMTKAVDMNIGFGILAVFTALLSVVVIPKNKDSVETAWHTAIFSRVATDAMILLMLTLLALFIYPQLSALAVMLTVYGALTTDIFIRQTVARMS